jgi:hypothetical protein
MIMTYQKSKKLSSIVNQGMRVPGVDLFAAKCLGLVEVGNGLLTDVRAPYSR